MQPYRISAGTIEADMLIWKHKKDWHSVPSVVVGEMEKPCTEWVHGHNFSVTKVKKNIVNGPKTDSQWRKKGG